MEITNRDQDEADFIKELHKSIQEMDHAEVHAIAQRIDQYQPFIISLILSFQPDVGFGQYHRVILLFYVIYLFFEEKTNIKKIQITEQVFKDKFDQDMKFAEYLEREETLDNQIELSAKYFSKMHFKNLYGSMMLFTDEWDDLKEINEEQKGFFLSCAKVLIECMEASLLEKQT